MRTAVLRHPLAQKTSVPSQKKRVLHHLSRVHLSGCGSKKGVQKSPIGKGKHLPKICGPCWSFLFDPHLKLETRAFSGARVGGSPVEAYRMACFFLKILEQVRLLSEKTSKNGLGRKAKSNPRWLLVCFGSFSRLFTRQIHGEMMIKTILLGLATCWGDTDMTSSSVAKESATGEVRSLSVHVSGYQTFFFRYPIWDDLSILKFSQKTEKLVIDGVAAATSSCKNIKTWLRTFCMGQNWPDRMWLGNGSTQKSVMKSLQHKNSLT